MNILTTMTSKKGFGSYFTEETWGNWRIYLSVLFGLPLKRRAAYRRATGLTGYTRQKYSESWVIVGRRGGKTTCVSLIACYLALFRDYSKYLKPGEKGHIFLIAVNMNQAKILLDRIEGLLRSNAVFNRMIVKVTAESIELENGVIILVKPASFRGIRGATLCAAIMEEISFLRYEEAAIPDIEIYRALKPGLSSIPGSMLIGISSPFQQSGLLYDKFTKWHGKPGGPLVWKASTLEMNPGFNKETVEQAYEEDAIAAATEYGANFRSDLSTYVDPAVVKACVIPGRRELAALGGVKYFGGVDFSGGRSDSATLGISHKTNGCIVLDCLREKTPPFVPDDVMEEFAMIFWAYKIKKIEADNYAPEFVAQGFKKHGITVINTSKSKSELYLEFLGPLNSSRVELLDNKRLISQLCSLDRRVRSGRDIVDNFHGHDDVANAAALACSIPVRPSGPIPRIRFPGERIKPEETANERRLRWLERLTESELDKYLANLPEKEVDKLIKMMEQKKRGERVW